MSNYLHMWQGIKELNLEQTAEWINKVAPPSGRAVLFNHVYVNDVDLVEALQHWFQDLVHIQEERLHAESKLAEELRILDKANELSIPYVIQIFMDEGLIEDQRQPNFD